MNDEEHELVPDDDAVSDEADVTSLGGVDRARFVDEIEARLVGSRRTLRRSDIADLTGVPAEESQRFWRALGFANPRDEDVVFTQADVNAMNEVKALVADGRLGPEAALGLARALGRTTDRLAMWETQVLLDQVGGQAGVGLGQDVARRTAELVADLADDLEPLLLYVWRRNLGQAVQRMVADSAPESHIGVHRTVGFADMVSFTRLVRELSERELARLVMRFEALTSDIVSSHGGALVKTVGDELLFTHQETEGATRIALELIDAVLADELIPRLRVGLARGRVLARQGDVFGTTVNRAARLTAAARPDSVLADPDVARAVRGCAGITAVELDPIALSGLGELRPWRLRRAEAPADTHPGPAPAAETPTDPTRGDR